MMTPRRIDDGAFAAAAIGHRATLCDRTRLPIRHRHRHRARRAAACRAWLALMLVSFSVIAAESPLDVCLRALAVSPETQAAIADRILMVDFWASWCSPCRRAMPYLDSLYAEFGDAGLAVLAVGVDEEPAAAREFLDRVTVSYPVVLDMNGVCPRAFDVKAMPSTYFLDRSGRVRHVHRGFRERDRETLRAQARALLAE